LPACVLASACGDDESNCVKRLCEPASEPVCVGQSVRTCAADGAGYEYAQCSAQSRCEAGACTPRVCTTIGQATCLSPISVQRCADDGSKFETIACGTGELCKDGVCAASECTTEADRCTNKGYLTCAAGEWTQETCPVGTLCLTTAEGRAYCGARVCTPQTARCDGATSLVCDARGTTEAATPCGASEACRSGHCQPAVCGDSAGDLDTVDVSEPDVSEPEPESQLVFTLNGATTTFDQSAYASFDGGERMLVVKGSKSTRDLEVRFKPASPTVTGSFSSAIFNPVRVIICYDAGGSAGTLDACPGGFTHQSKDYTVEVTRNDGPGGRFEATFSVTLEDENRDTIELKNGQIGVKYR
jgi:hypothetical protein